MYQPNPIIVARAVDLWKRALAAPKYQHERPEFATLMTDMQSMMAARIPKNNTPDVLDKFGAALHELLLKPDENGRHVDYLGVDYGPDSTLQAAADVAGLRMEFPWKTRMYLLSDCVSFSIGAGGHTLYHHPMPNGRWLLAPRHIEHDLGEIARRVDAGDTGDMEVEG